MGNRIGSLEVALTQSHAMVNDVGDVFYPDSRGDVYWLTHHHGARPLHVGCQLCFPPRR